MVHKDVYSPTRKYVVTVMAFDDSDTISTFVELPHGLINNVDTVRVYYQKYVPEGYAIVDVVPFEEAEEKKKDYTGFGDDLDYVGPEEDPDGLDIDEDSGDEDLE